MGMTYNYVTGQVTRDFHLKKKDGMSCSKSNLPPGVHCLGCEHYKGDYKKFVRCGLPGIEDDKSAREAWSEMYEKFTTQAISHYYD
jgi:hypothetical protein